MERQRNSQIEGRQGETLVNTALVCDVEGLTGWTPRLLIRAQAVDFEALVDGLLQDLNRSLSIFLANGNFHAAQQVGDEPIQPHEVVVDEKRLDAGRVESALRQQRRRYISKLLNDDEFTLLHLRHRNGRRSDGDI